MAVGLSLRDLVQGPCGIGALRLFFTALSVLCGRRQTSRRPGSAPGATRKASPKVLWLRAEEEAEVRV